MTASPLERSRRDPVFMSQATPTALLGRDLVIHAVTPSYLAATGRREEELIEVNLFDAFPESPALEEVRPAEELTVSLETALRTKQAQHLSPLRYDIPDSSRPGEFREKTWGLVNAPIQDGPELLGVMIRIEDLTLVEENITSAMREYRDLLADGDLRTSGARNRVDVASSLLAVLESHRRLGAEVTNLREALRSRPVIEQAKGVIMADRRCSPEEAFQVLKQLSMNSNVRLAEVAAAVVYQLQARPDTEE